MIFPSQQADNLADTRVQGVQPKAAAFQRSRFPACVRRRRRTNFTRGKKKKRKRDHLAWEKTLELSSCSRARKRAQPPQETTSHVRRAAGAACRAVCPLLAHLQRVRSRAPGSGIAAWTLPALSHTLLWREAMNWSRDRLLLLLSFLSECPHDKPSDRNGSRAHRTCILRNDVKSVRLIPSAASSVGRTAA